MKYGYIRVSTKGQAREGNGLEVQKKLLKDAGAEKIYADVFTGGKMDRPELSKLMEAVEPGDTIIITKLDRFARSIGKASERITDLIDKGIRIEVLDIGILDNSSMSTLFRNMLLAFAQFERDMILERTMEGKDAAKERPGFREGRPKKFNSSQMDLAMELLQDNTYSQTSLMTGISKSTLVRERRKRNINT